jgi:phage gp36-like protein
VSNYAAQTDLEETFTASEITQLMAGGRDVDVALAAASQEADSYLATRYAVPITADPLPKHLVEVVCDITCYRLYAGAADDEVQHRYAQAIQWLKDVSAGKALLPGVALDAGDGSDVPGQSPAVFGQAKSNFCWDTYPA